MCSILLLSIVWPNLVVRYFSQLFTTRLYQILKFVPDKQEMYSEYGDVYGTSIMGEDELVICDPRVYDTVLVSYSYVYLLKT